MKAHIVFRGSRAQCLYNDALQPLLARLGPAHLTRAGRVDPFRELDDSAQRSYIRSCGELNPDELAILQDKWFVDLCASGGPVTGPFASHQSAIDFEVAWLKKHRLKVQ